MRANIRGARRAGSAVEVRVAEEPERVYLFQEQEQYLPDYTVGLVEVMR